MLSRDGSITFFYVDLEIEGAASVVGLTPGNGAPALLFIGPRGAYPISQLLGRLLPDDYRMRVWLPWSHALSITPNQMFVIPVPADTALRDVELGMQGAVIDPAITSNPLNLDLTNGLAVRVGG